MRLDQFVFGFYTCLGGAVPMAEWRRLNLKLANTTPKRRERELSVSGRCKRGGIEQQLQRSARLDSLPLREQLAALLPDA
jgi:hypothetical protein